MLSLNEKYAAILRMRIHHKFVCFPAVDVDVNLPIKGLPFAFCANQ